MKIVTIFLITISFLNNVNAQLIVDDSVHLKRGIYTSFEEFRYNNPSIVVDFEVEKTERLIEDYFSYKLIFKDNKALEDTILWGFCDGTNVYIRGFNNLIGRKYFDKVLMFGRYCYFERYIPTRIGGYYFVASRPPKIADVLININNGKFYVLDKSNLELILKQDQSLFEEYLADTERKKNYLHYIELYNERHKDQIKQ